MSEYLIEYISISTLLVGVGLYLLRHKHYLKSSSPEISQARWGKKVKNGYMTLLDLVYYNCDKDDLEREIKHISIQLTDDRYIGGYSRFENEFNTNSFIIDYFYKIINYTDSQNKSFIFSVNSTVNIEEFNNKLRASLPKRMSKIEFPFLLNSELKDMLFIYQEKLNNYKIQMTYLSDGSDTYYFVLHPVNKENAVKKAIRNIGLQSSL